MSARQFSYYSNWETETLTCPQMRLAGHVQRRAYRTLWGTDGL